MAMAVGEQEVKRECDRSLTRPSSWLEQHWIQRLEIRLCSDSDLLGTWGRYAGCLGVYKYDTIIPISPGYVIVSYHSRHCGRQGNRVPNLNADFWIPKLEAPIVTFSGRVIQVFFLVIQNGAATWCDFLLFPLLLSFSILLPRPKGVHRRFTPFYPCSQSHNEVEWW